MVDLLGIISFFLLSLVVRKLVVGYLKDTNAGEWVALRFSGVNFVSLNFTACALHSDDTQRMRRGGDVRECERVRFGT